MPHWQGKRPVIVISACTFKNHVDRESLHVPPAHPAAHGCPRPPIAKRKDHISHETDRSAHRLRQRRLHRPVDTNPRAR